MMEIARHLRDQGHRISLLFLRGGQLEDTLTREAFDFSVIADVQVHPYNRSEPVDPASFDVVVVNTIVTFHWLRYQVEAWGLSFLRKVVWWIREHPRGSHHTYIGEGPAVKRHILARCGSAAIVSETTWRFYEAWVLERAFELGLDYSPLVGRQESFGPTPPLPPALPNLRIVRNPLPPWIMPLLEAGAGGRGFTRLPECSRASPEWPHANLRQQFRGRINATDEDYVLILVGTNIAHKGTARLVSTFARAWQQVGSMPGAPGRLLLVCIGQDMLNLAEEVRQAWAGLQPTRQPEAAEGEAVPAANTLPAAIHLLDGTANSTERLGWYAAADVQVLNSECESFGRVTVEGMAASLPLLATACGGTLELVQEGVTGLLHPSPSTGEASDAALLQHILRLDRRTAAGRTLAERLGAAGCRRTHSEFLPRQFLSTVEALLQQVAGTAAVANAEAAAGLGVAPSEGLTPGAAGPLRSGWAAAFMPTPANQAQVVQRDMRWSWEEHGPAPLVASESKSFQVGSKLFILSGDVQFLGGAGVVPQALVSFDLGSQQWQNETVALPPELAETHVGTALVGGRYVFIVAGQVSKERHACMVTALQQMHSVPWPFNSKLQAIGINPAPWLLIAAEGIRVLPCHHGSLSVGPADDDNAAHPKPAGAQVGPSGDSCGGSPGLL
jgi:glycosyltransferase involved in cell wall biosynthesis